MGKYIKNNTEEALLNETHVSKALLRNSDNGKILWIQNLPKLGEYFRIIKNGQNLLVWAPFNGFESVDLGLPSGTLWATCNIGATSPEQIGNYYMWGEATTKAIYNTIYYKYGSGSSTNLDLKKYNTNSNYGKIDNKTILDLEDDTAHMIMGGEWLMPTVEQIKELCEIPNILTTLNGIKGWQFTGSNGNTLFIPASGTKTNKIVTSTKNLYLWSNTLDSDSWHASILRASTDSPELHYSTRSAGIPVRGVINPNK